MVTNDAKTSNKSCFILFLRRTTRPRLQTLIMAEMCYKSELCLKLKLIQVTVTNKI